MRRQSRKGSLSLSINAIVVLIMAIAMLGVGIFFINSVLRGSLGDLTDVGSDVQEQIQQELQRTGNKLFISGLQNNRLSVSQGGLDRIVVGINNREEANIYYAIRLELANAVNSAGAQFDPISEININPFGPISIREEDVDEPELSTTAQLLSINDYAFEPIQFRVGSTRGDALYRITILYASTEDDDLPNEDDFSVYASQTFFVTVR